MQRESSVASSFLYYGSQQQQLRNASNNSQNKNKKGKQSQPKKKVKGVRDYQQKDLSLIDQYALCDAMRFVTIRYLFFLRGIPEDCMLTKRF